MITFCNQRPVVQLEDSLRGPQSETELAGFRRMLAKSVRQSGVLEGFHGTSASRARKILESGFANQRCVEGAFGIWFHDDTVPSNARLHGEYKARDDGEMSYAVIHVQSARARPDMSGRLQWIAPAESLEILGIAYFELEAR